MKKVVIIGANSFQNPLILKAKEMGYETHVFAWRDGSVGERTADYFYPVSIVEREAILEKCREIAPAAVASIGSDLAMLTVNYVAEQLGLVGNSMECTLLSTNKYEMRKAFRRAGVPVPEFALAQKGVSPEDLRELTLPVIVKPTDRSGSRGVTRLESWDKLKRAVEAAVENSFEKRAIVEECLQGEEYSCECISYQGKHSCLTMTKKYTTGAPHFIETGHLEPPGLQADVAERAREAVFQGLDALKVANGASHGEFMVDEKGEIRLIEIGARMGGDCIGSDLVPLSTGYDYTRMVLQVALGEEPSFEKIQTPKGAACIRFIFSQEDLKLLNRLQREIPEKIRFISEMEPFGSHPVTDSSTRYGFFIAAFDSVKEKEEYMDNEAID